VNKRVPAGKAFYFLIPFPADFPHRVVMDTKRGLFLRQIALMLCIARPVFAETAPIKLDVDATDATRNLLHARLHIPASPGKLTLVYPKWIPGEHMPSGPINGLTGLQISANGHPLDWQRDPDDMFTFHLEVPAGADAVDVALDFLLPTGSGSFSSGVSSTAKLLDLSWNELVLYPQSAAPLKLPFAAALRLPAGWKFGTALPVANAASRKSDCVLASATGNAGGFAGDRRRVLPDD
jgi:hypothetical protein